MILEYVSVATGAVLDTIEHTATHTTYTTGRAREIVANRIIRGMSKEDAINSLIGWSNGYVLVRRRPD
jgi:hypothetical protein